MTRSKLFGLISLLFLFGGLIVGLVLVRQPQLLEKRAAVNPSGSTLYFIHQDQLGSTSLITDATGAAVSRLAYYPYGSTRSSEGDSPTQRQYTGQIADTEETGLYYYNARYYHPAIGKFTQADTANDGLNRYAYVGNNPLNKVDPTGTEACYPWESSCLKEAFLSDWQALQQLALAFTRDPDGFTDQLFVQVLPGLAVYGGAYLVGGEPLAEAADNVMCVLTGGGSDCALAASMSGPNLRATDDVVDLASLKNNIISGVEEGGTNVTARLANPVIDQMIKGGSNEMDAIALVGNGLTPSYSLDSALLRQASKARSADELMGCPAAICRHNQMITRDIAASRGYDPYLGWLKGQQGGSSWSHGVTVLYDQAGAPFVIDPTNFRRSYGVGDYITTLNNQGVKLDSFTASSFSNWSIENRLIPE